MMAWPKPPRDAALHGPAGEFVLRTAPHTEADPMALLAQFLVAFGAAAGRNVRYTVEALDHHLNEFVILVGTSGKGRKGSSWDHVEALLESIDEQFAGRCISSGLSSGEGSATHGTARRSKRWPRTPPSVARDAHVAIVGHITKDELLRFVTGTELANGFFNRFLVIAVKRSKELPFGGQLTGRRAGPCSRLHAGGAAIRLRQRAA